jgi:hypothetical protein
MIAQRAGGRLLDLELIVVVGVVAPPPPEPQSVCPLLP